jgi:hypothetical protein
VDQDYYLDYNISNAIISKLHLEHNCVLRGDCVVKPVESATNKSNQNELIFKIYVGGIVFLFLEERPARGGEKVSRASLAKVTVHLAAA